jgi:NADH:ubiquinone oxidoreductase subunit 5 (subunit L)/multisubunit Na+/H+ antiporter MnhA subunit
MNGSLVFIPLVPLLPLLPLLAAAGIAAHILSGKTVGDEGEGPTARLSLGAAVAVLLLLLFLDAVALIAGTPGLLVVGTWLASGDFVFPISFAAEGASLALATGVAFISWVTVSFSIRYLHREEGFHRFFLALCLFLAGMQVIVLAGNGLLAFVGWEFCGLSSYLLIGYAFERPTATSNAIFAFVANRIGDAGFLLGLAIAVLAVGTTDWHGLAVWAAGPSFDKVTARLMLFGLLTAAVAKSAQLPFAPWIARALEGPTPSSAIFYGAVMVHAGVWLVIRLAPVLVQVPDTLVWLAGAGLLTALYGWLVGLVQSDVKSALMFATTTQVGLMFLECGLGWFTLATWHLGLHALWRAWQFLMAPSYLHLAGAAPRGPAWLTSRQGLWTAALQRWWLDHLAWSVLARPLVSVGHDLRDFDDQVLARIVGMPPESSPASATQDTKGDTVIRAHGLAGTLLLWTAGRLQRFETRLILGNSGHLAQLLRETGDIFRGIEDLLEQPRYLLLMVAATFVVIL